MSDTNTPQAEPPPQDDEYSFTQMDDETFYAQFDESFDYSTLSAEDFHCEVIELTTEEECQFLIENTIRTSGFTKEELIRQAKEGRFENGMARRTWFAVAELL